MCPTAGFEGEKSAKSPTGERPDAVRIRLLGGFAISIGSRTIEEDTWRLKKAAALVKFLALAPRHRLHREQAMDILWPELGRRAASNNLRKILHAARKVLDPSAGSRYLASHEESLVVCPKSDLWVDVDAFEEAATTAHRARDPAAYRAAVELYAGELLPADRYEEWAEGRRQQLRHTWLSLHLELARAYEERTEYEKGIEVLQRALLEEPTNEQMHASLMRLYAFSEQQSEALAQYQRLREALSGELDAQVSSTTERLLEEIAAGTLVPTHPTVAPTAEPSEAGKHDLPAPRTSFVGREHEMVEIKRHLAMTRLLTLTGTGGSGKTRLALEVSRDLVGAYPDGVWLVELAGLSEGNLVPQAVAGALGIREQPDQSLTDTLVEASRGEEMLLVLDNCEHLVEAAAQLVDVLLDSCPHLRVMTTSREALAVAGEVVWRVLPLSLPDPERPSTTRVLEGFESVRLFVERARQRDPAFALTADNAQSVAEICRQLDGIPLALELAAARVGTLGIAQISERLENSLGLLTASIRQAARRQWTLRGALDWSYDLLICDEKKLFRRLSVFAGGWTLEAAAFVGSRDGVEQLEVFELLSRLVDKSLVMVTEVAVSNGVRYRFLEPVRQYAREKLDENRKAQVIRGRHAAFFLALAEEAEPQLRGPEQAAWFDRLDIELDNLRAALAWLLEHEKVELGLKLSVALLFFWMWRGFLREGRRWLEEGLSKGGTVTAAVRADALTGLGELATMLGEYAKAMTLLEESLALYREASDSSGIAGCLCGLGWLVSLQGNHQRSTKLLEESIARSRELEDNLTLAFALTRLAGLAMSDTDYARATALLEESLELYREAGDRKSMALCLEMLGYAAIRQGDLEQATELIEEGSARLREAGVTVEPLSLINLGLAVMIRGQHERAAELITEGLVLGHESGNRLHTLQGIETAAMLATRQAKAEVAARLWGAAETSREVIGVPLSHDGRALNEPYMVAARTRLDEEAWRTAWEEGRRMTLKEAVEYALARKKTDLSTPPAPENPSTDEQPAVLTRRQEEIATLVAQGLTNRQIASERSISEHTAATHVRRILKKLGLQSRSQIGSWLAEQRP